MTFDDWYRENERRIYAGHMNTREAAMAAWYGARECERDRAAKICMDWATSVSAQNPAMFSALAHVAGKIRSNE